MPTVYLGLGSSLGDRIGNLRLAVSRLIFQESNSSVVKASSVYESPHLGANKGDDTRYPPHLNAAVIAETALEPEVVLSCIHKIEEAGGRERNERWGPRTIDIDLLLYDNLIMQTDWLTLPHPELANRAFVAVPLFEIAPDLVLPDGRSIRMIDRSAVIRSQKIEKVAESSELFI